MVDDEIVRDGTRRVVGRASLRRLSRMVQDWRTEEEEKAALARTLFIAIVVAALIALGAFQWFIR